MSYSDCTLPKRLVVQLLNPLIYKKATVLLPAVTEPVQQPCCHCAIDRRRTGSVRGADAHFHSLNQLSSSSGSACVHLSFSEEVFKLQPLRTEGKCIAWIISGLWRLFCSTLHCRPQVCGRVRCSVLHCANADTSRMSKVVQIGYSCSALLIVS